MDLNEIVFNRNNSSRDMRADVGLNKEDDDALKRIAVKHFSHYNRSLMIRSAVKLFLKLYDKTYQFHETEGPTRPTEATNSNDTVVKTPEVIINTVYEDPWRMIRGYAAIASYIGMSYGWVALHKAELIEAGAMFTVSRGRIGGITYAAVPYFLATYFASKYKPDSYPHGGFKK